MPIYTLANPEPDPVAVRRSVAREAHHYLANYLKVAAGTFRYNRALAAWKDAKSRATEAVRVACREEASTGRQAGYNATQAHAAALRRATAEIARQEAIIAKAQRLLKEARASLAAPPPDPIDDGRHERAKAARARADRLSAEAHRLQDYARGVAVPPSHYRKRTEALDLLRAHAAANTKYMRIEIDPEGEQISMDLDESGNPNPLKYLVT